MSRSFPLRVRLQHRLLWSVAAVTALIALGTGPAGRAAAKPQAADPPGEVPPEAGPAQPGPAQPGPEQPDRPRAAGQPAADDRAGGQPAERAVLIQLHGPITRAQHQYIMRSLRKARKRSPDLLIVEIESPGGLLQESELIAEAIREIAWARTVAWIPREALSGAAIVSLGFDEIVMRPTAVIGDAGPIFQDEAWMFRHAPEKVRSDLAVRVRTLAAEKEREPALAEAMVDLHLLLYRYVHRETGQTRYLSEREVQSLPDGDQWEQNELVHESREDHFLELNGQRAVELGFAQRTLPDRQALLESYGVTRLDTQLRYSATDTAVYVLNLPIVTILLFIVGLVALYLELSAPGIGVGALVSGLSFTLFFWSRFLGGTAGWLEVILFLGGIVFLAMELFVIPGFGIAGIGGVLMIIAGLVFASLDFVVPHTRFESQQLGIGLVQVVGALVAFLLLAAVLTSYLGRIPILSQLALKPPTPHGAAPADASAGGGAKPAEPAKPAVHPVFGVQEGDEGVAESPLRPAGKVVIGDHLVDVVADGSFIEVGRPVRIIRIQGNRVVVREIVEA